MQALPQPLQFFASVATSTHSGDEPAHFVTVAGVDAHVHAPAEHVPSPHPCVHEPQCNASVCRFTHCDPHLSGVADGHAHAPPLHEAPRGHALPHAPQ